MGSNAMKIGATALFPMAAPLTLGSGSSTGKSSPPPSPDYAGAAQQQGNSNLQSALLGSYMNNPNVNSPYGTQTYNFTGQVPHTQQFFDPEAYLKANPDVAAAHMDPWQHYSTYGINEGRQGTFINPNQYQPTVTQNLSPAQQSILDKTQTTQGLLGDLGIQGASSLKGVVGTPIDFSGAPTTGSYDTTRQNVINAMMSRANEDYGKQTDQTNSDLIAAGIRPGSKAYDDRMQMIERSRNDARQQAEIAGGNAASQAYGMDADRRKQAISEYLSGRQTPINEISALLSGSQVNNPFSTPGIAQNANMQPMPSYQATSDLGNYNADIYNAKAAQQGQLMSGLFGLGGAGLMGALLR